MPKTLVKIFRIVVYLFAIIGFVLMAGFVGVKLGLTNVAGRVDQSKLVVVKNPAWAKTAEWQVIKDALIKDSGLIKHVSAETGVPARLIATQIVPEQLRLFYSEREIFKQFFAPLKILGNQTQFSWGVAGIKQETAKEIEKRAGLVVSDEERFKRLTDENDHYYSYLYTALYLKEVTADWKNAGFDISKKPEILSTLFNIGFANSKPNADPKVGGAVIEIDGQEYTFGSLAYEFYYSDELADVLKR